ncbi:hypothetical protein [Stomatohabitans albus]|uniref:hypothetical protein n=1 Tax=Stomatohabitans albus TaxID=3110766 RepID=UPI00300C9DD2
MRKFNFRMERVARVRAIARDQAKAEWAQAQGAEVEAQQSLDQFRQAATAEAIGVVPGATFANHAFTGMTMRAQSRAMAVTAASQTLAQRQQATQAANDRLIERQRQVDAIEKLRVAARERWQEENRLEEAKTNDDLVGTRAGILLAQARRKNAASTQT